MWPFLVGDRVYEQEMLSKCCEWPRINLHWLINSERVVQSTKKYGPSSVKELAQVHIVSNNRINHTVAAAAAPSAGITRDTINGLLNYKRLLLSQELPLCQHRFRTEQQSVQWRRASGKLSSFPESKEKEVIRVISYFKVLTILWVKLVEEEVF